MKTASFFQSAHLQGRISIARSAPRGMSGYNVYRQLAPGKWFRSVSYERYCTLFGEQLAELDPQTIWGQLHNIASPHEPVLLCWEQQPLHEDNWCHRRIVARWFLEHLGHEVEEIGQGMVDEMGNPLTLERQSELV